MQLKKDKATLQNFEEAIQHEWLETNGLGGWASSTIIGANSRRYHGLLVAATKPPAERMSLLSKLDETIISGDDRFEINCNQYNGNAIHPQGYQYLQSFTKDLFPEWIYEVNGIQLKKTIAMVHGENTTIIIYRVLKASSSFTLEFLPLISARGYHSLQHSYNNLWWDAQFEDGIFHNQPYENAPSIFISVPGSSYKHQPSWFNKFNYAVEIYRGQDFEEDLLNHGRISVELKKGDSLGVIISTESPEGRDAHELFMKETVRRKLLLSNQPDDKITQQLILAADQFIVRRDIEAPSNSPQGGESFAQHPLDENAKEDTNISTSEVSAMVASPKGGGREGATVIAGYHWFTDWGRDTMISLPGLTLSTGRYEDAKKIIAAFANSVSMGMLPNRFQDNNEPPEYNNVDGTLWYFIAVFKYLQATGDKDFVLEEILPVLKNIIDWHYKGTRYNIHVTEDGLLYAGEKGQQLTWMDARIGDWVVTPRMGKPVEIQALWYNVLKIFAELLELNGQNNDANIVNISAEKAKQSFTGQFWYEEGNYLYDVIDENGEPDSTLRPNQLFALSLPYALIEKEKAKAVLKVVTEKLYTPVGLKSLTPDDVHYTGVYGGDAFKRDSSYHEGTVWSWLLGPFVDAIMKVGGKKAKSKAAIVIENFKYHLNEGCIGSVSEIMDADGSHHPRGCIAQAWGVAEVLRVIKDHELYTDEMSDTVVKQGALSEA